MVLGLLVSTPLLPSGPFTFTKALPVPPSPNRLVTLTAFDLSPSYLRPEHLGYKEEISTHLDLMPCLRCSLGSWLTFSAPLLL